MTDKRQRDLEELDFVFVPKRFRKEGKPQTKTWDESFLELLQYRDIYGHVSVPPSYPHLNEWVIDQVNT